MNFTLPTTLRLPLVEGVETEAETHPRTRNIYQNFHHPKVIYISYDRKYNSLNPTEYIIMMNESLPNACKYSSKHSLFSDFHLPRSDSMFEFRENSNCLVLSWYAICSQVTSAVIIWIIYVHLMIIT